MSDPDRLLDGEQKNRLASLLREQLSSALLRRARILLLYDQGLPTRDVAAQVGLSAGRARYWRLRFRRLGLAIFPLIAANEVKSMEVEGESMQSQPPQASLPEASTPETADRQAGEPGTETSSPPAEESASQDENLSSQPATPAAAGPEEAAAAQPVASTTEPLVEDSTSQDIVPLALALFDLLREPLEFRPALRPLLETAASRLPAMRSLEDQPSPAAIQEWLAATSGENPLPAGEQEKLAVALFLAEGKLKKKLSPVHIGLGVDDEAVWLAGILRIASRLADIQAHCTVPVRVERLPRKVTLVIDGPEAEADAQDLERQVKGWKSTGLPALRVASASSLAEAPSLQALEAPGVLPADRMAEAGRKLMRFQLAEMLSHEEGTRLGEDIEALHDMRVATRRLRAAFDIFAGYFHPRALRPFRKQLRRLGRALGRVRDLDVFMEKLEGYRSSLPEDQQSGLDPLMAVWQADRENARQDMLDYLDSQGYHHFRLEFARFLDTPGEGARAEPSPPEADRVCELAPVLVYTRFGAVRSFEPLVPHASVEQLHLLRLEFKKLRYTVEFFREVLGSEVKAVIDELKKLQDHLGELHDAQVATQMLSQLLDDWDMQQQQLPIADRQSPVGIVNYLARRHAERYALMMSFRSAWEAFQRPEFHRSLADAIAVL